MVDVCDAAGSALVLDDADGCAPLHAMAAESYARVREMEASGFWRLRSRWHALKARLRLPHRPLAPYRPAIAPESLGADAGSYAAWRARHTPRRGELARLAAASRAFARRPLISIVIAVYETPERYLRATLDSVLAQVYDRWQLCIADDASHAPHVRAVLADYAARDDRIAYTLRSENGHISRATNSALDLATGEFVAFLDHDDLLAPDALYEVALLLNEAPETDVVYTDEDKIDDDGTYSEPHFKPDWAPESFLSRMYTCHLCVMRRTLVADAGGLRPEFDGSQDYDLMLRATERTDRIAHIARVLYHWRIHPASTAGSDHAKPYATAAAERALGEALRRRGEAGIVTRRPHYPGTYLVRYIIAEPRLVSVIVPTRDHGTDVERAVRSALARTAYPAIELLVVDNGSTDAASLRTFASLEASDPRVRVVRYDVPFNFSRINNYAVTQTTGTYLVFLNNDTEVRSDGWIEALVEQAQRPAIGAVGALLVYPDGTVQHAGVIVGLGGVAGHSHKGYDGRAPGYFHMLQAIDNYSALTAAAMMVRRDVFTAVGGFDESLAVAFNDVDLCLRIGAAGYRNVYLPHVELLHDESKTRGPEATPEAQRRFAAEVALMQDRWQTRSRVDPYYNPNLTLDREDYSLGR